MIQKSVKKCGCKWGLWVVAYITLTPLQSLGQLSVTAEMPAGILLNPGAGYSFHIGMDLILGEQGNHVVRILDMAIIGEGLALLAGYRYHFMRGWWLDPFLGTGGGYIFLQKYEDYRSTKDLSSPTGYGEGGLEIYLLRRDEDEIAIGFSLSLRYLYHPEMHYVELPFSVIFWF